SSSLEAQGVSRTSLSVAVVVAAVSATAYYLIEQRRGPSAEERWAFFDRYCVECHNRDDYTADLAFERHAVESIADHPELFEEVVRKLRGNMMPPPGWPRPDARTVASLVGSLETSLDSAAAANPNPGRVTLHRLNRTEYANAIQDLFGIEIDAAQLLPKDDESEGFDNVAEVLKVSPSFLDQYIAAARTIATLAVGDENAREDSRVFYAKPNANQNFHV